MQKLIEKVVYKDIIKEYLLTINRKIELRGIFANYLFTLSSNLFRCLLECTTNLLEPAEHKHVKPESCQKLFSH